MKHFKWAILLVLALGGCATLQNALGVFSTVSTATVSAAQVSIAASSFDVLENAGAAYISLPLCSPTDAVTCRQQPIAQTVYTDLIQGRAARNQLEAQINSGTSGSTSLYNVLVTAINSLQSILPAK